MFGEKIGMKQRPRHDHHKENSLLGKEDNNTKALSVVKYFSFIIRLKMIRLFHLGEKEKQFFARP